MINYQQDRVRGSLVGGAIGDALGFPVEFLRTYEIIQKYFPNQYEFALYMKEDIKKIMDEDLSTDYPLLNQEEIINLRSSEGIIKLQAVFKKQDKKDLEVKVNNTSKTMNIILVIIGRIITKKALEKAVIQGG